VNVRIWVIDWLDAFAQTDTYERTSSAPPPFLIVLIERIDGFRDNRAVITAGNIRFSI
jgi:hypothetical protein